MRHYLSVSIFLFAVFFFFDQPARADIGAYVDLFHNLEWNDEYMVYGEAGYWFTYDEAAYYDLLIEGTIWDVTSQTLVDSGTSTTLQAWAEPGHQYVCYFNAALTFYFYDVYFENYWDCYGYSSYGDDPPWESSKWWTIAGAIFVAVGEIYEWSTGEDADTTPPRVVIQIDPARMLSGYAWTLKTSSQQFFTSASASGTPAGGNYEWSLGPLLTHNGSLYQSSLGIIGTNASASWDDTWIRVRYTYNGAY
jgi:hypothetical protein